MIQISKNEYLFICQNVHAPCVTICSKRKHGAKGSKMSGKTYYCPESSKYLSLIAEYRENVKGN